VVLELGAMSLGEEERDGETKDEDVEDWGTLVVISVTDVEEGEADVEADFEGVEKVVVGDGVQFGSVKSPL